MVKNTNISISSHSPTYVMLLIAHNKLYNITVPCNNKGSGSHMIQGFVCMCVHVCVTVIFHTCYKGCTHNIVYYFVAIAPSK